MDDCGSAVKDVDVIKNEDVEGNSRPTCIQTRKPLPFVTSSREPASRRIRD